MIVTNCCKWNNLFSSVASLYLSPEINLMDGKNSLQITRSGTGAYDDDGHAKRTGNLQSAVAHIITAVIGSGVLSLAWSTSQLGWIGGPVALLCCAIVTYISSFLLSDCYRTPDPVTGKRNYSYMDAVRVYLGYKRTCVAGFLQFLTLYGTSIAYVLTTATSLRDWLIDVFWLLLGPYKLMKHAYSFYSAILRSNCYHKKGHEAPCKYGGNLYMALFGLVQIVMSFIPDLHNMAWVSVVAALMSFTYSFIGLGLGIATVIKNGRIMGSLTGIPTDKIADKFWLVFQALGDIAFAYPYSILLLEIQDTLESPPPENQTMKKASMVAIFITTFFYLCCGCFGYAAFGNDTPGNLLTGFGFFEPFWLIDLANACIILHLVGGYQIYSQPIYSTVDRWASRKFPNSGFVNNFYKVKLPLLPGFQLNLFRFCFRTTYVISTTGLAIFFPYFNQILGVLGAINFWPLAIYFPVEMYFVQNKIAAWSSKWIVLRTFSFACFLVTGMGLVGSLEGIMDVKTSLPIVTSAAGAYDDDGHAKRTGNLWSAVAHIITAVIGSGVLSLAWSTSQLGWIGGPVALLCFAIITYVSSSLLSDCYRTPDPVTGKRNYSYMAAVRVNLGKRKTWLAGFLQFLTLYGTSCAYVLTTANSLRAILKANCYHKEGHQAPCGYGDNLYMVMFGVVQIGMSFIPDLHNMVWVSVVAAIMSFTYSFIGLGLGIATVIVRNRDQKEKMIHRTVVALAENGRIMGSITGIPAANIANKLWLVFQALGDIAFAYPYALLLLEIQDTLESTPPENKTMKKASMVAIFMTTFFYLCCGCFGYAAFGNDTPGNLLTGFGFYEPYWLVAFANACIIIHLVGGYQMYSQPIYTAADRWCSRKFPNSVFANKFYRVQAPLFPGYELNLFRFCFRTAYVISTTGIAMLFPYFNQVLGVLGAINFWPLAIYFPVEMYLQQKNIGAWTRKWILLRTFSFACFLVTVMGLVGDWVLAIRSKTMREEGSGYDSTPFLDTQYAECHVERTGTVWTAVAHIVTGVIGSGVLSLAWSIAQLGWVGGPLTIVFFAAITLLSSFLLSNTYRSPDPELGPHRSSSYLDAVNLHKGEGNSRFCAVFVNVSLYGFGIAYVITAAISMRAIQKSNCSQDNGNEVTCGFGDGYFMLIFGAMQVLLSQIPNFHNIQWLSILAAIMSFAYAFIGMGLSVGQVTENGHAEGSIEGIPTSSGIEKLWLVAQALGDIAFSYPFSVILIEIQDTLKSPPPENVTMKRASTISVIVTTFFYLCCGCFGYAAFGNDTPGNLLTGFALYKKHWLVDFANACIVIHLVGAYQVYSQPLFANVENWLRFKFPDSEFVNRTYSLKLPLLPAFPLNFLRLTFRTAYVASTTGIAMIFPYFNQILGVLAGIIYYPLSIYFPVEMYLSLGNIEAWTAKWVMLRTFSIVGFLVGLFTLVGSIEGIVSAKLS
ncbi:putative amino acid permease 7 [Glycine soja]